MQALWPDAGANVRLLGAPRHLGLDKLAGDSSARCLKGTVHRGGASLAQTPRIDPWPGEEEGSARAQGSWRSARGSRTVGRSLAIALTFQ